MAPRRGRPSQNWAAFLRNHGPEIAAIDLLTVTTATFARLYAFVVLAHARRRILHVEVANRPTALWLASQIAEAFAANPAPTFLVRYNDGLYGRAFRDQLRQLGLDDRPTRPHSPWQNGHVERLIGSMRRECLNHCIIWNAAHLRRVLKDYAAYYNSDRTHLAWPRTLQPHGRLKPETASHRAASSADCTIDIREFARNEGFRKGQVFAPCTRGACTCSHLAFSRCRAST
jgi:transposase InsO family protein